MILKDVLKVFIELSKVAQKSGILTLEDAVIIKTANDSASEEIKKIEAEELAKEKYIKATEQVDEEKKETLDSKAEEKKEIVEQKNK